jgi:hypothetical protein
MKTHPQRRFKTYLPRIIGEGHRITMSKENLLHGLHSLVKQTARLNLENNDIYYQPVELIYCRQHNTFGG